MTFSLSINIVHLFENALLKWESFLPMDVVHHCLQNNFLIVQSVAKRAKISEVAQSKVVFLSLDCGETIHPIDIQGGCE